MRKKKNDKIERLLIAQKSSIKDAMKQMSANGEKLLFVVSTNRHLIGTLSDGDIRRWILAANSIKDKVDLVCNRNPIVAGKDYRAADVKACMLKNKIEYIPVVENGSITNILLWNEIFNGESVEQMENIGVPVVVMAGGKGSRLDPFTAILPKPLIPIGEKPVIEIIIDRFVKHGVNMFYLSVNHKADMIKAYFDDLRPPYNIRYVREKEPLGTAGAIGALKEKISDLFITTNCDIIVEHDYADIVKHHKEYKCDITMVVSCKHYVIPYGVCKIKNGGLLGSILEKPEYDFFVNTGMYVFSKKIFGIIRQGERIDMNELIQRAKAKKFKIGIFPIGEDAWIDIGQWKEYHKAVEKMHTTC